MLLEIAIGDAYGAGFEFCAREKIIHHNTLASYVDHELGIDAGRYTDDTQMSIAVAETLLEEFTYTSDAFADAFVRCYRRDQRLGYAKGFQLLLLECETGAALRAKIRPDSRRNGAAMRSVPLGLIADKSSMLRSAQAQAAVTHNTEEGILSAQIVALMAHSLLYETSRIDELAQRVESEFHFSLNCDWQAEVECDALQTVHAVCTALLRNRSMASLLIDCVNFGGDVDSVAAIAMGLASLSPEYRRDIPNALLMGIEQGNFGSLFLGELDAALARRFPILLARHATS